MNTETQMTLRQVKTGESRTVAKVAPLGDPIEVTVRGYELSLRKAEAACILMA